MLIERFFKLCRGWGLSEDVGLVLLSDRVLAFAGSDPQRVVEVMFEDVPILPAHPPDRLPDAVRDGLTTRVHTGEYKSFRPVFERGEMLDYESAEASLRLAIRKVVTGKRWFIKPRVVCCVPWDRHPVRKRAWLEVVERAGARLTYLTRPGTVAAVGLGLDVIGDEVHGVFWMERDWSVFAVVSYADEIAYRMIPVGSEDIPDPSKKTDCRDRLLDDIASALAELRPVQATKLSAAGLHCLGGAATLAWTSMLSAELGMPCRAVKDGPTPVVVGLRKWVNELDRFKTVMDPAIAR